MYKKKNDQNSILCLNNILRRKRRRKFEPFILDIPEFFDLSNAIFSFHVFLQINSQNALFSWNIMLKNTN